MPNFSGCFRIALPILASGVSPSKCLNSMPEYYTLNVQMEDSFMLFQRHSKIIFRMHVSCIRLTLVFVFSVQKLLINRISKYYQLISVKCLIIPFPNVIFPYLRWQCYFDNFIMYSDITTRVVISVSVVTF